MADETSPRRGFLYRRRRWLIALAILVVAVRAALPEIIRRVAVSQLSSRLQTRVEIGDVDLALYRGGVVVKDVAVFSPMPGAPDEPPLISWQRFAVELRYPPLFRKTIQLREIALDAPHVSLDRLANGEINLQRLVPPSPPAKEAPAEEKEAPAEEKKPEEAKGSGWSTGIDRFVLRSGGIRFRDLTLTGGEPLEIRIPDVTVDDVALQPGLYGAPGRLSVRMRTEGGSLGVESRIWVLEQGFALSTRLKAFDIPLARARLYLPGMGWSELRGQLDAVVDHGLAPGGKNVLGATVRLRDVSINVPDLPNAAFSVQRVAARIDPLDLAKRRLRVRQAEISGAAVVVDLQSDLGALPLLRGGRAKPAPAAPAAAPAPEAAAPEAAAPATVPPTTASPTTAPPTTAPPAAAPPPEPAPEDLAARKEPPPPASPFRWTVDAFRITGSKVFLLQEDKPLEIAVEASVDGLHDEGNPARLDVKLAAPPGSLAVAGVLRPQPPAFGGTVKIDQLPVADLARAARAAANLPSGLLKSLALGVDLAVEAGLTPDGGAPTDAHAVRVKGTIGLDTLQVEGPDPAVFAVGWKRLALPIDALDLPAVLPGAPAGARPPIHVALGAIRLESPSVQLTRTAEGIILPPPLGPSADAGAKPAPASAAPPSPPPGPPSPPPDVTIASFVLSGGRVRVVDRTVKPFFTGELKPLDISARGIRSNGPSVDQLTLTAATPTKGKLEIAANNVRPDSGTVRVNADGVALAPYNPFVTAFSPYSLGRTSAVSVKTQVVYGKGKYDTQTALTLHKLSVKGSGGDTLFKQQFGIPLSMALALLRDPSGNIKLDIPVAVDEKGTKIGLGTVIAGALRSALVGAVTSPLKAVGFALGGGDKDANLEPPPIGMEVGRAVPTADGEKHMGQLAEFLGTRPGVGLELDGVVTAADARWLAEQDLRAAMESRKGVGNALRDLPERRVRQRVMAALADRAAGKKGELDDDDRKKLDEWLAERPALPPARLQQLARDRCAAVAGGLKERYGIAPDRVTIGDQKGEAREGDPSVVVAFGAGED